MLQKAWRRDTQGTVMLLAFYNTKALGVRYLWKGALEQAGYQVQVFIREFNSHCPGQTSRRELELLCEEVRRAEPVFIGLFVMSSMYLDTVEQVMKTFGVRGTPFRWFAAARLPVCIQITSWTGEQRM